MDEKTTESEVEAPAEGFMDMTAEEAVAFDFFNEEKPEKIEEPSKEETPKEEPAVAEPVAAPPVVEKSPVETPVVQDNSELLELRRQNQLLTEAIARQTAEPKKAEEPKPKGIDPIFGMQVPDELVEAMAHEDPRVRRNATTTLINGAADIIYRKVVADIRQEYQQTFERGIQQRESEKDVQTAVARDFYGNYPEFDKPELRKVVMVVADDVGREIGAKAWSPQLRDAIGARLRQMFNVAAPPSTPQSAPQVKRATPRAINPGTRPTPPNSGQEGIVEFLGLDSL